MIPSNDYGRNSRHSGGNSGHSLSKTAQHHRRFPGSNKYMQKISDTLSQVKTRIQQAATKSGRNSDEITLLAVSKRHTVNKIQEAHACGHQHFGENYLQEALEKINALNELDITWHFIGSIQSNKTRAIAESFSWVHTVERLKVAQRLSQQRPSNMAPLNICLQVNIDDEESKSGLPLAEGGGNS